MKVVTLDKKETKHAFLHYTVPIFGNIAVWLEAAKRIRGQAGLRENWQIPVRTLLEIAKVNFEPPRKLYINSLVNENVSNYGQYQARRHRLNNVRSLLFFWPRRSKTVRRRYLIFGCIPQEMGDAQDVTIPASGDPFYTGTIDVIETRHTGTISYNQDC